jgi:hypothetical protein
MFRIVIAQEGCVYHDAIEEAMTRDERGHNEIVHLPPTTMTTTTPNQTASL